MHWWSAQTGAFKLLMRAARFEESPIRERSATTVAGCMSSHTRARTFTADEDDDDVFGRLRLVIAAKAGMTGWLDVNEHKR